jgi:DNA-binding transcriptional regulator YdaS (Cro superfamily)
MEVIMGATPTQSWRANVARAHAEATVADLKTRRAVYEAVNAQGATQMAVASVLGVSQPTVHRWLQEAAQQPVEGPQALGETPYEIAQRYAAGDITHEQMIDALVAWPYQRDTSLDGDYWDKTSAGGSLEGTFGETVGRAFDDGLITGEDYDYLAEHGPEPAA